MSDFEQYLSVLNDEQRQAVEHVGSPLLILAGAGSGKTRVITTKIAYLINQKNVNPLSILSVTFTKKAANEMKERAIRIEPEAEKSQIRTFHSFGSWFLRRYSAEAGLASSFTVYDDDDAVSLLKEAAPELDKKSLTVAAREISLAKDYFLFPEDDLSFITESRSRDVDFDLNTVYKKYQNRLQATGNADFGDLIMLPAKIMEENQAIKNYIRNRFEIIMVDEYQDSNIAQYRLLQTLSGVNENSGNYVCVVGDDDQSIYHFRGAEVQNILSFPDKFPGTQIIRLETNYRSTAKILHAADLVVKNNMSRLGKTLIAERGDGKQPVLAFPGDYRDETKFCASLIQKSISAAGKYSDWAILYRTNAQSLNFEKEFLHQNIPYRVVGSLKFYQREEVKDAISYLSLYSNHRDEVAFRRIINKPARGISDKKQDLIITAASSVVETDEGQTVVFDDFLETARNLSEGLGKKAKEGIEQVSKLFSLKFTGIDENKKLSDFVKYIIDESGLTNHYEVKDEKDDTNKTEYLQELVNSAAEYSYSEEGLEKFLSDINLDRSLELASDENDTDAVTLITLHNTKGLEYNKVIITGLEEGVFPRTDKIGADLEEERRLFYVGITRARNELYVTSSNARVVFGTIQTMRPSGFLKEARDAFKVIGQVPFNFMNSQSVFSEEEDDELQELLHEWKKGTVVYHDDYGNGEVRKSYISDGEVIIEVAFNGLTKKFLPKYQRNKLTRVGD